MILDFQQAQSFAINYQQGKKKPTTTLWSNPTLKLGLEKIMENLPKVCLASHLCITPGT